jgi:hypothetical protein
MIFVVPKFRRNFSERDGGISIPAFIFLEMLWPVGIFSHVSKESTVFVAKLSASWNRVSVAKNWKAFLVSFTDIVFFCEIMVIFRVWSEITRAIVDVA